MDIGSIINKCGFHDKSRISFNPEILYNYPYLSEENDDLCTDLETLYNFVVKRDDSYGSSYGYTQPPYKDNDQIEHYNSNTSNKSSKTLFISFIVFVIIIIICCIYAKPSTLDVYNSIITGFLGPF